LKPPDVIRFRKNESNALHALFCSNPFMRKIFFPSCIFFLLMGSLQAHTTHYYLDFSKATEFEVSVRVQLPECTSGEVLVFPGTIPGTYATIDYGRFIRDFRPVNKEGNPVKFVKEGKNAFKLKGPATEITYKVKDSFHNKVRKDKIFEPAGTNIQPNKNLLVNEGGFFCYRRGHESDSAVVHLTYPENMVASTAMPGKKGKNTSVFYASNYHELVDCPIMVTLPDTSSFYVSNCHVTLTVFNESGRKVSEGIREELRVSMKAISDFFHDTLPVNEYAFIFYIRDYTLLGEAMNGKKPGLLKTIKLVASIAGKGFGALEHGNSSVYFLPDLGEEMLVESVKDVAIHEFMHIITPLNLHSECIGSFNYENPKMSRHLWLYEGVTEYFAGLIQVRSGIISRSNYVNSLLRQKMFDSSTFPYQKMSFAEMSENVLVDPYKDQYGKVYTRGALMAALLDIRIISLTKGEKSLETVVKSLYKKYGQHTSFSDETFFDEFVKASHPAVADFINRYITGKEDLPIQEVLSEAGISYLSEKTGRMPQSPFTDIRFTAMTVDAKRKVKKVGEKALLPLQVNDRVEVGEINTHFGRSDTAFLAEGTTDTLQVYRKGQAIRLFAPVRYKEQTVKHLMFFYSNPTEQQLFVRRKWMGS
jgi:predicted metalloprotease with PDZ domain